jgi:hypothetical protein
MSHVSTIKMEITDLDSLEKACELIGMELVRGQTNYRWFGKYLADYSGDDAAFKHGIDPKDYGKCEHALRVAGNPNAYEVGLVKNPNGPGWVLIYDFWAGGHGLQAVIGNNAGNLRREYALQVGMRQMARKGFRTERVINPATNKARMRAWRA